MKQYSLEAKAVVFLLGQVRGTYSQAMSRWKEVHNLQCAQSRNRRPGY